MNGVWSEDSTTEVFTTLLYKSTTLFYNTTTLLYNTTTRALQRGIHPIVYRIEDIGDKGGPQGSP
jgi:hypothetical protein